MGKEDHENISEETRVTLKVGLIAGFLSAFVIFILTNLWIHQTDITLLKTNQNHVLQTLVDLRSVPADIARVGTKLDILNDILKQHDAEDRKR